MVTLCCFFFYSTSLLFLVTVCRTSGKLRLLQQQNRYSHALPVVCVFKPPPGASCCTLLLLGSPARGELPAKPPGGVEVGGMSRTPKAGDYLPLLSPPAEALCRPSQQAPVVPEVSSVLLLRPTKDFFNAAPPPSPPRCWVIKPASS